MATDRAAPLRLPDDASAPDIPPATPAPIAPPLASRAEKVFLYTVLSIVLAGIAGTLVRVGVSTAGNYQAGIELAQQAYQTKSASAAVALLYTLQLSRAYDAVVVKASALFLGYVVVLLGCMFVLKGVEASYRLRVMRAEAKSELETSSPGLVLITLGAALVAVTVLTQSTNTIDISTIPVAAGAMPPPTATPPTGGAKPYEEYLNEQLP